MKLEGLKENEPLSKRVMYRIGGPARWWFEAKTSDAIAGAVAQAEAEKIPWVILGGGSNILVSDEGFGGLVILAANRAFKIDGERLTAEAGAVTSLLARKSAEAGLSGLEWAAALPGTIGGAVRGNAGCFGSEMRDIVESVEVLRPAPDGAGRDGQRLVLTGAGCGFGYRDSVFKSNRDAILSVVLKLRPSTKEECQNYLEALVTRRQTCQPANCGSAGCVFKNFEFKDVSEIEKLVSRLKVPDEFLEAKRVPAGWLIEQADFKGRRLGGAQVSPKHANFIVNLGGATASDVLQLISLIKMRLRDDYGIQLEEEVQLIGF